MIDTLVIIAHALFGWAVICVILSWLLALLYPPFAHALTKGGVIHAASFTLLYGLMAPAAAMVALVILSLPNVAFTFIAEHCHAGDCAPHSLQMTTNTLAGIVTVSLVITLLTGVCVLILVQLFSSRQKLHALKTLSKVGSASYRVVDSPAHVAWCAGLFKPVIYLSRGLLETLSAQQLKIILAHELTHLYRRDNLRKWLLHWATIGWPKHQQQRIKSDALNYSEHACDLAAAEVNTKNLHLDAVIETLSIYQPHCDVKQRIQALERELSSPTPHNRRAIFDYLLSAALTAGLWLLSIIAAIYLGHPLLEWLSA